MGLDTSHGCWHGAYSAFSRWRNELWKVAGYDFERDPKKTWHLFPRLNWSAITEDNLAGQWESTPEDPLVVLIAHSDCDGSIYPEQALHLADRLEQLLPLLPDEPDNGHIGVWQDKTQKFIDGLRQAAALGEPVKFY